MTSQAMVILITSSLINQPVASSGVCCIMVTWDMVRGPLMILQYSITVQQGRVWYHTNFITTSLTHKFTKKNITSEAQK